MPDLRVVETVDFASTIVEAVEEGIAAGDRGTELFVALSGGTTPRPVYASLGERRALPWRKIVWTQTDERAVPDGHPRSNLRLIGETLLRDSAVKARVLRMPPVDEHSWELERFEDALPEALDVAVLGIGEDAHIASIFPSAEVLWGTGRRVSPSMSPTGEPRVTLTPEYLLATRRLIVMAAGSNKAAAVRDSLNERADPFEIPGALLRNAVWVVDRAAAQAVSL